jgi:hypothetical protein
MLRSLKDLESYTVHATDGDIGKVTDFLFDDHHWTTRYLVTDTGGFWQGPNQVLISPISFQQADWATRLFHVALTRDKVKNSPSVDLDKPVSRQYERDYAQYYGWAYYWGFGESAAWGAGPYPMALAKSPVDQPEWQTTAESGDPHLRSAKEVAGYHVSGSDGEIGHIADFIVDDESWTVRYLVIDTSNWWFGKKVLVAPQWAQKISWAKNMVYVNLTKDAIMNSPVWNPEALINREFEQRLYDYYGRPAYWLPSEPPVQGKPSAPAAEVKYLSP